MPTITVTDVCRFRSGGVKNDHALQRQLKGHERDKALIT